MTSEQTLGQDRRKQFILDRRQLLLGVGASLGLLSVNPFEALAGSEFPAKTDFTLRVVRTPESFRTTLVDTYYKVFNPTNPDEWYLYKAFKDQTPKGTPHDYERNTMVVAKFTKVGKDENDQDKWIRTTYEKDTALVYGKITGNVLCNPGQKHCKPDSRTISSTHITVEQVSENGESLDGSKPKDFTRIQAPENEICQQWGNWYNEEKAPVVQAPPPLEPTRPAVVCPPGTVVSPQQNMVVCWPFPSKPPVTGN